MGSVEEKLSSNKAGLIQADTNLDTISLMDFFPELFNFGWQEIPQHEATTPKGRHYDHVLYKGVKVLSSNVIDTVGTDHYPIVSTFRLDS